MISEKLSIIELEVKFNIYKEQNKLTAIRNIQDLLLQIDFETEIVPTNDIDRLKELISTLKGKALNEEERELLSVLID
jgi:hypothetical protein